MAREDRATGHSRKVVDLEAEKWYTLTLRFLL